MVVTFTPLNERKKLTESLRRNVEDSEAIMMNLVERFIKLQEKLNSAQFYRSWHMDTFDDPSQENIILSQIPEYEQYLDKKKELEKSYNLDFKFLFEEPRLTKEQTFHILRKYNFLKYKYKQLASAEIIQMQRLTLTNIVEKLEYYNSEIAYVKHKLICSNTKIIVNIIGRWKSSASEHIDMISAGCMALTVAADYFDYRREEAKFTTYAFAIVHDYMRKLYKRDVKHNSIKNLFDKDSCNILEQLVTSTDDNSIKQSDCFQLIEKYLTCVDSREREIIIYYYGLNGIRPHTLKELGKKLSLSSERIKQIRISGIERIKKKFWAEWSTI